MSDLSTLKEEILEWANKPGTMKKFTTHDVYDAIHSAEDISKTSDTLRGMWRHDKTLEREEFMDGNRKRFFYWLKTNSISDKLKSVLENNGNIDPVLIEKATQSGMSRGGFNSGAPRDLTKGVSIPEISWMSKAGSIAGNGIGNTNNDQQIEIPNNFCIELKTPNGFTITIKAGDLMK